MGSNKAGYEYLATYKLTTFIYDFTVQFTKQYVNLYSRTGDQMVQAGRSGRQNIAEGHMQESLRSYIKLVGVARGSLEELLKDYEDFARQNSIPKYEIQKAKDLREIREIWEIVNKNCPYAPNSPYKLPQNKEVAVNLLITLINQANFLLDKQIKSLEKKFIEEGGFTENLLKKRLDYRAGSRS